MSGMPLTVAQPVLIRRFRFDKRALQQGRARRRLALKQHAGQLDHIAMQNTPHDQIWMLVLRAVPGP